MKKIISTIIILSAIIALSFVPIFNKKVEALPNNAMLFYWRIGGIAGFYDKYLITDSGRYYINNRSEKSNGELNVSDLAYIKDYIKEKRYKPLKVSLFDKYFGKDENQDNKIADYMSEGIKIKDGSKSIEIERDSEIINFVNKIVSSNALK